MPVDTSFLGARSVIWIDAELHLFFAAFILGAPIFIVLMEYLGVRTKDQRYERLAKETMKVVAIAYGVTAILGVLLTFTLLGAYQEFSSYLFVRFSSIFRLYGILILLESLTMYVYFYTWEPLADRKRLHIGIGIALNVLGTAVMLLINGVASFMLTPPEAMVAGETVSTWAMIFNPSFTGLNLHRFIANITFGGFMVAFFAAFMYLTSKKEEDKAFYDWMGFIGNFIGVGTLLVLPVAGYIYAKELFLYDAAISTLLMADKLSWFFEFQGVLVSLLFLGANYYMWLGIQRIEGGARFINYMKVNLVIIFVGTIIWVTPQNFLPDLATELPEGVKILDMVIPEGPSFVGLMMAKALAITGIIIVTFITYLLYRRAIATGSIVWGRIDIKAQYVLIFIPAVAVYLMGLMGAIRELAREGWHVYQVIPDTTNYWFIPPLAHTAIMTGIVTLLFFTLMSFIFVIGFKVGKNK